MIRFFSILVVILWFVYSVTAQDAPKVCISQESANKCVSCATELIAARDVIAKFQVERATSLAEREAANTLIKGLNDLIVVKDRIDAYKDQAFALYERVIAMQKGIIDDLEKRLMKPKSAWQKFVAILKNAAILLAGITLGRGI